MTLNLKSPIPNSKFQIPKCSTTWGLGLGAWSFFFFSFSLSPFLPFSLFSQGNDPNKNYIIEKRIEMIAEANEEATIDFTTMFDELNYLFDNPLNLNFASKEDLQQMTLLTDIQINNLLEHIARNGKLISIYELQGIDGFDLGTIQNILPFVKVSDTFNSPHISFKDVLKSGSTQLFLRDTRILEKEAGFQPISDSALAKSPNSRYLGDRNKLYSRYRFSFGNRISCGVTGEKDPGEQFFKGTQKNGFDFYSAHLYLRNFGMVKHFVVGDYQLSFGQGLTFWSGLAFAKTADVMNIKKNPLTIKPYISTNEILFMRGTATTVSVKDFDITGFYSRKKIDAVASQTSDTIATLEELVITSLQKTGFHRTPSEMAQKHIVGETIYGTNIEYKKRRGNIGFTLVKSLWDAQFQKNLSVYNQFTLDTNRNMNVGLDYSYIFHSICFFGEGSRSQNGGIAYLNGALASLTNDLSISVLHRNFGRDYQSVYSNAFSEGHKTSNEKGFYFGLNFRINNNFTFAGYIDKFQFPWLQSTVNAPSDGTDYLAQLTYKPSKRLEIYVRYRQKLKEANAKSDTAMIVTVTGTDKQNLRFNSSYKVSDRITLRNRAEFLKYQLGGPTPEYGYVIFQDIMFSAKKLPLSGSFRYAMFQTDSYNSKIYTYENNMLFVYAIPAYYYRGSRAYIIVEYNLKNMDIWLRVAQTYYSDRNVISSGLSQINGNTKTEVQMQVRYKF